MSGKLHVFLFSIFVQFELVLILLEIEKTFQISEGIIGFLLRDVGRSDSSFTSNNGAPIVNERLARFVFAMMLFTNIFASIVHMLKLFNE